MILVNVISVRPCGDPPGALAIGRGVWVVSRAIHRLFEPSQARDGFLKRGIGEGSCPGSMALAERKIVSEGGDYRKWNGI